MREEVAPENEKEETHVCAHSIPLIFMCALIYSKFFALL